MFEKLKRIISKAHADYVDIRYEVMKVSSVSFSGRELNTIGSNTSDGFVVRVLKGGGYSTVSFTKEADAERAVKTAVENAEIIAANIDKPVNFAPADVIKDEFVPYLQEDPRAISIEEKLALTKKYNELALCHEKVVNTQIGYADIYREKFYLNREGTEIREELVTSRCAGSITTREGNLTQSMSFSSGGSDGFYNVRNQEAQIEERQKLAVDLLKAKPVNSGVYNVILNPSLAGVFTHEAFGHFSEADIVESLPAMRAKMQIGNKMGNDILNIVDNATMSNQLGLYKYDDEGVAVRKVQLVKNGILSGRLHNRRTAAEFNEPISGHNIAEDFRFAPIVRMGTIFIEPGKSTFNELLSQLQDGLYLLFAKGGQTAGENFTFGAQVGYVVKNGKISEMIRDINISGNLYQTLLNINAIGNDFELSKAGGCGKGQTNIRSTHGGPHILINNLVVGGI